ncbi:hypothetical protein AURDEDRAFT_171237 [Auricularia subglabra TFB-10046 SS5]|uniref:Uncharacterized protein n=1 Tax=Auricularia subglabra (strain TFB-10046 / SS5) TaxID=717982 RepID=J0WWB5_AURST|nr:hypothetical protein AURDEDRAFT_171237 [Auricularia subglabra TFB-10046 SS5]
MPPIDDDQRTELAAEFNRRLRTTKSAGHVSRVFRELVVVDNAARYRSLNAHLLSTPKGLRFPDISVRARHIPHPAAPPHT